MYCDWLNRNVRFKCRAKQTSLVVNSKACRRVSNSDSFKSLLRFVQSRMTAVNSVSCLLILLNCSTLIYEGLVGEAGEGVGERGRRGVSGIL